MNEADNILASERSRNRPDRIVNAFAPGYVIAESDETNNTMCIMTFTNAPGEGPPPHTHTVEDETFIVHEGVLEFYQDDRTFTGHPGDVVYLVRGKRHYFKVISGNPAKYTVVCVPGGFDRFFREAAVEFKKLQSDIATLIGIGAKYGIHIEAPPPPEQQKRSVSVELS